MKFDDWNSTEHSSPQATPGIYILLLKKQIPKIYKKDPKGILYIGESKNLRQRLKVGKHKGWEKDYEKKENSLMFDHSALTFTTDIDPNRILRPHKYSIDDGILKETDKLYLKYALTNKYKEFEKQLLFGHIMLYGQLPPFNNKGPTLKYIWNELSDYKWEKAIKTYKEITDKI